MTVALAVRKGMRAHGVTSKILGVSPAIAHLRDEILAIGRAGFRSLLIQGESGVGKELVAEALRLASGRAGAASEVFDCPAVPEDHLESELFGTARGAFPGAVDKAGVLERADGGTVFFDEIGAMRRDHQAKVLRAIEGKAFRRVGGSAPITVDVVVIAAAHQDLAALAARDGFRHDLFYRLTHDGLLVIPPLRERPEDVAVLVRHFATRAGTRVDPAAHDALTNCAWPGNVRQLLSVLRIAQRLGSGVLTNDAVEMALRRFGSTPPTPAPSCSPPLAPLPHVGDFQAVTIRAQRRALVHAFETSGGNKTAAGILLGFHRSPNDVADGAPTTEARRNLALRKFRYWTARLGLSAALTRASHVSHGPVTEGPAER